MACVTIKTVTGRDENGTTYTDSAEFADQDDAFGAAILRGATVDVFEGGQCIGRVHVDGGIDWY